MFPASCDKDLITQDSEWFAERSGRNKMLFSGVVSWDTEGGYKCQRHLLSMGVSGVGWRVRAQQSCDMPRVGPLQPPGRVEHLCPSWESESQWVQSIFILVPSPSCVALQAEKAFTAFYFSLPSLLVFHFSRQFCSSQPLWTKPSENEISGRSCCILFSLSLEWGAVVFS